MTPLCELARKYETDKGGEHYRYGGGDSDTCHAYTPVYHALFERIRNTVGAVLEIGVNSGSSLRMWRDYFPNAEITGLDIDTKCLKEAGERIYVAMADQNSPEQLRHAVGGQHFDIIIDDGSHERHHQVVSMQTLLPYLMEDGFYIVEDLGTGPEEGLDALVCAVPSGYVYNCVKIVGGLGPKVQPHEWLFVVRRAQL